MKKHLPFATSLGAAVLFSASGALALEEPAPITDATPVAEPEAPPPVSVPVTPYLKRYKPEAFMFELGLFGGVMFPGNNLELLSVPDALQVPFNVAGDLGVRVAFFPATFFGVEAEAAAMPSGTGPRNLAGSVNDMPNGGSGGLWAVRGHGIFQLPGSSITPFALVGGGALGASSQAMGNDTDPAFHFGVGVKAALDEHISFRLDVRDTLSASLEATPSQAGTAHSPEILFGLTFVPRRTKPDADGDGFLDQRDDCPGVPGTEQGCPPIPPDTDADGISDDVDECKDVAGIAPSGCPDQDGDTLPDKIDPCPAVAGPLPSGCPDKECPVKDSDGDGLVDSIDECPSEPARTLSGCVVLDQDGDGILDAEDKCPAERETKNGFDDTDGCPDAIPEKITKFVGVIKGIEFDYNSAKIKKQSEPLLREAAGVIKSFPEIKVLITGHTDNQGERENNLRVSAERAEAVKAFLVKEGVPDAQLQTKGAGPDLPIVDNATPAGRQKNRRIEFAIQE
jgi:outer membrane protein OmpA-like peptidoglycan-associated protein